MSSTKRKKKKGISREQLKKIWRQIDVRDWLTLFQEHKPNNAFQVHARNTLLGRCPHPDHADHTPSFWLHSGPNEDDRCFAKCFGCGYFTSNPVELIAITKGISEAETLQFLQEKYNLSFLPKKAAAELEARRKNQLVKNAIFSAARDILVDALANSSAHPYAHQAVDWLINQRHVPKSVLSSLPVGIMPPLLNLQQVLSNQYKRRFKAWRANPTSDKPEDLTDDVTVYLEATYNNTKFNGAIIWPLHVTPKEIGRLKLRVPVSGSKDYAIPEDDFEENLGLYGLGWDAYKSFFKPGGSNYVYVTEGEMDAMSVMAQFMKSGSIHFPIVSAGGLGGAAHIEPVLKESGIEKIFLIGDSPKKGKAGGDTVVQGWLENIRELPTRVFVGWDELLPAGDLDEAVNTQQLGIAKVEETIWKKSDDNFTAPWNWAFERARHELDGLNQEDHRALIEKASEHGRYLRHRLEEAAYVKAVSEAYPQIPERILKLEITTREDNELGFILRVREALSDIFFVVGTLPRDNGRDLLLFHKINKTFTTVKLDSEQSIASELAPLAGNLVEFTKENVGFPAFLTPPDESEGLGMRKLNQNLRMYTKEAVNSLAQGAVDTRFATKLNQGYHCMRQGEHATDPKEYIVCGRDVFRVDRDGPEPTYELLAGPSDRGIVFNGDLSHGMPESWVPHGLTLDALNQGKDVDLKQLYEDIVTYYQCGFRFKNHDITARFLAAIIMLMPIMDVFPNPMMLFVTGETHSGKSSLLASFAGMNNLDHIQLLQHSNGWTSYSAKGVIQAASGDSRLLVLDEFELDGKNRHQVQQIYEIYRSMITGEVRRVVGQPLGVPIKLHLRHPVLFAAITAAEKPQDLNRLIQIEMHKTEFRTRADVPIMRELGREKLDQMRRGLCTGMYPHALKLRKLSEEIMEEYVEFRTELPVNVEWRFASNLYPVMALFKMLDIDWKQFFWDYAAQHEDVLTVAGSVTESETYLDALLQNSNLWDPDTKLSYSVSQMLINSERRAEINSRACGVYYDSQQNLLLFLVEQVIPRLLPPHLLNKGITSQRLKDTLGRHRMALSRKEIKESGILQRVGPYLGAGVKLENVVVLKVPDSWLRVTQDLPEEKAEDTPDAEEPSLDEPDIDEDFGSNVDW